MIVGAQGADEGYVYERTQASGDEWIEVDRLYAGDGFYSAMAIDGDTLVVGCRNADGNGGSLTNSGTAYIFERTSSGSNDWHQVKQLIPLDAMPGDSFGNNVALDGDTVIVGTWKTGGKGAYIYGRNEGGPENWGLVKHITNSAPLDGDFGYSVALSGDTAVIGTVNAGVGVPGATIFLRNYGGLDHWGEIKTVTSEGVSSYGSTVALSGDTLIVYGLSARMMAGEVHIHERNVGGVENWGLLRIVTNAFGSETSFGRHVAITGDTLLVGYSQDDWNGPWTGSAFLFLQNEGGTQNWGQAKRLTASDGLEGDGLGKSVAIDGNTAVIGAPNVDDNSTWSGAVYVYDLTYNVPLHVSGVPDQYGAPTPYGYGSNLVELASPTSDTAPSPVGGGPGTRHVCTGWTGTGDIPSAGESNAVHFTPTMTSTLTWHWVTERFLDTEAAYGGSVNVGDGWHTNGTVIAVTAIPSNGYCFAKWAGDVAVEDQTNSSIMVVMDQGRSLSARFASTNLLSGLVLHYDFNEDEGGTTTDTSGMGNHGLVYGATHSTSGLCSGAFLFDGANDYVDAGNDESLQLTSNFTVSVWVNMEEKETGSASLIAKKSTGQASFELLLGPGNSSLAGIFSDDSGKWLMGIASSSGWKTTPKWYHVVLQHDTFLPTHQMRMYVDGVEQPLEFLLSTTPSIPRLRSVDAPLRVACGTPGSSHYQGTMDEVQIYDRVLAPNEVLGLYGAGSSCQDRFSFTVAGNPDEHDTPGPLGYGTHSLVPGTMVSNAVSTPADQSNGVRYACAGWTGAGSVPASGTNSAVAFTIVADSTLTWQWAAEYLLDTETAAGGDVDVGDGWYTNGAPVAVEATPLAGWLFSGWTGDVPEGMATNNPLTVTMDQPRVIQANFTLPFGAIAGTVTYSGTNSGPIRVVASGRAQNRVLELDGVNDVVAVPDSNELDLRDTVTLEARVWFRAIENRDYIVGRLDEDTIPAYRILVLTGGQIGFALDNARRVQGGAITTGRWCSVAATYDGTRMRVYIDGDEEASIAATGSIDPTTWGSLFMGGKHISGDTYELGLDGYLDDVRVWNRALAADEVRQYASMSPMPGAAGLVGHWNFNDGTAADATTNANDGTLVGDAAVVPSDDTAAGQHAATISVPGSYVITNVPTVLYHVVRAYRDADGDWREDGDEPAGFYLGNPVFVTNAVGGVDIELLDKTVDGDGDGLMDYDEAYVYGTDPGLPDKDGDGSRDGDELVADTSPTNAHSVLSLTGVWLSNDVVRLEWTGGEAAWQYVERRQDLLSTVDQWSVIFTNPPPTPMATNFVDTEVTNAARFYRIKAER